MSAVDDLIAWLRQQLNEDERKIAAMEREQQRVQTAPIFQSHPPNWLAGVDIFVSPKRWRAEVEAKRRILDEHPAFELALPGDECCRTCGSNDGAGSLAGEWPCTTLRLLAQPYAGRDGWREEWRVAPGS